MSVVDLHPEDLLDRDASGELTPVELARLEKHLAQCKACRLERQVRADFAAEEDASDDEFDVQRLLSEVLAPGTDRSQLRVAEPPRKQRRVMRRLRPLLLVAAALCVAGVSAAAGWGGLRLLQGRGTTELVPVGEATNEGATARSAARTPARTRPLASAAETAAEDTAAPVSATSAPTSSAVPPPPSVPAIGPIVAPRVPRVVPATPGALATSSLHAEPASVASPSPPAPGANAEPAPTLPVTDAASLFARANRARRAGDRDRATDLYRALIAQYPGSEEANESQAMLGHELLDDGQAGAALHCFDEYLRVGGPLQQDVMVDRALALGHLGRSHDEAEAWSALVRAYPGSVHVDRARGRLRELGNLE
jgi:TolA-binding protein